MSEDYPANLGGFRTGSLLAGYRLEAPVGKGGMAVVFRARDERLSRPVALKILSPGLASDSEFRRRFIGESRAAAAVDDPHIIPVYEAGEADGVLFIAMRFVQGGDLRMVLDREGALSPDRTAGFVSPVASALDAAHAAGLVHRDVKPGNILVDRRRGRPDHVYLSDFGVSKSAVPTGTLTGTGIFIGTPDYGAPEQIQGLPVDGRADQYSLACVTYNLLTGTLPFDRTNAMAVMLAHVSSPPPSLSSQRPDLPEAADQVVAKGMAKLPEERYETCGDFADALRDALGLSPYDAQRAAAALAHPPAPPEPPAHAEPVRPVTIIPLPGNGSAGAAATHSAALVTPEVDDRAASAPPDEVVRDEPEPDEAEPDEAEPDEAEPDEAEPDEATPAESAPELPGTRADLPGIAARLPETTVDKPGASLAAAETQDIAASDLPSGSRSRRAEPDSAQPPPAQPRDSIADLPTEAAEILPPAAAIETAEATPEAPPAPDPVTEPVAAVEPESAIEPDSAVEPEPLVEPEPALDSAQPAPAQPRNSIADLPTEAAEILPLAAAIEAPEAAPEAPPAPDPVTEPVAAVEPESAIEPDSAVEPEPVVEPEPAAEPATVAVADPESREEQTDVWPASGLETADRATEPGRLAQPRPRTAKTRRRVAALAVTGALLGAAATIPFMLSGSAKPPPAENSVSPSNTPHSSNSPRPPSSLVFSRTPLVVPPEYSSSSGGLISSLSFSPVAGTLAIADSGGICLWDLAASDCGSGFASAWSLAFSPDGKILAAGDVNATGTSDQVIRLLDVATGKLIPSLTNPDSQGAYSVVFSRDGKILAAGDANGSIYLWNLATRSRLAALTDQHSRGVNSVAFSRDEKTLAAGDGNGTVYLWDVATHNPIASFRPAGGQGVNSVAFSPDGKTLAAANATGSVYLWDVATKSRLAPLTDPRMHGANRVVFSPDGKILAAGATDGSTYVWDVTTGKLMAMLRDTNSGGVNSVVFSPDGKTLATGDLDGGVSLWHEG